MSFTTLYKTIRISSFEAKRGRSITQKDGTNERKKSIQIDQKKRNNRRSMMIKRLIFAILPNHTILESFRDQVP